jgi:hypothetical protein
MFNPDYDPTRIRRLRILAKRLGCELVQPWMAEQRNIGPFHLIEHGSGVHLDTIEKLLNDKIAAGAKLRPRPSRNKSIDRDEDADNALPRRVVH